MLQSGCKQRRVVMSLTFSLFRHGCLHHIRSPYLENSTFLSVAVVVSLSQA